MGPSTFISAALHVAIVLFVIVSFPSSKMAPAPLVAIPVDLSTPSDVTKVKAGTRDAKDEGPLAGKPEPKKPQAVKERASKAPERTASIDKAVPKPPKSAPKPEPKTEKKAAASKPEKKAEAPKPQAKPSPPTRRPAPPVEKAETPKPSKPKKQAFDSDKIAALLNKIPDAKDAPEPQERATETKPVHGQTTGTNMTMSVNELDALRARIADCWTPPPGGLGADAIVVKIRLKLNKDGTLEGYPTVTNQGSSPFFQAAADSAVRAVYQCQPYALPAAKYALWRDMILNFDPSLMYRSG
jgi:hypothetical protein